MIDRVSTSHRSKIMRTVGQKHTGPERKVRSLLHRLGYRFRLHIKDLPGTPDIVLPGRKVAIFVHGCFWHGHECQWGQLPKSKLEYWGPKIAANKARDVRKAGELQAAGWRVVTVWQCDLKDSERLVDFLTYTLGPPGCRSTISEA